MKTIGQKEIYESPSLSEINIKAQQCIATSGNDSEGFTEKEGSWY